MSGKPDNKASIELEMFRQTISKTVIKLNEIQHEDLWKLNLMWFRKQSWEKIKITKSIIYVVLFSSHMNKNEVKSSVL